MIVDDVIDERNVWLGTNSVLVLVVDGFEVVSCVLFVRELLVICTVTFPLATVLYVWCDWFERVEDCTDVDCTGCWMFGLPEFEWVS